MPKRDKSDSKSEDASEDSSSEEAEAATHGHPQGVSEYEKQRLSRIAENRARLEALGLPKMASSLKRPGHDVTDKKRKRKVGDDEEYVPDDAEARLSSSSGEDGHDDDDDDDDDEDFVSEKASRSRKRKVKEKSSKPKARVSRKDRCNNSYHIDDDDEALMQAIALSLQDSAEGSCFSDKHVANTTHADTKGKNHIQEDKGRRKNKKSFTSRLQMTEDEVILHFFEIDETGRGSVTMRDLQRVAAAHDFVWTDKELSDMIRCFDSNNDGKLSLEDFRKIIVRCNMIKGSENS